MIIWIFNANLSAHSIVQRCSLSLTNYWPILKLEGVHCCNLEVVGSSYVTYLPTLSATVNHTPHCGGWGMSSNLCWSCLYSKDCPIATRATHQSHKHMYRMYQAIMGSVKGVEVKAWARLTPCTSSYVGWAWRPMIPIYFKIGNALYRSLSDTELFM